MVVSDVHRAMLTAPRRGEDEPVYPSLTLDFRHAGNVEKG